MLRLLLVVSGLAPGLLSLASLPSGHPLNILQETIVLLCDQVETAWFAVLLKFGAHELHGLFLVGGDFGVVEQHAIFLPDELREKLMDVSVGIDACVHLAIGTKSSIHVSSRLVSVLSHFRRQIFHLLLEEVIVCFKDNRVLR